ncbi:MAG: TonB-dependent receptor [Muribaculaceae bacterium]|nr:TonB-dependent receptor [Muribaculaceae bacterium]
MNASFITLLLAASSVNTLPTDTLSNRLDELSVTAIKQAPSLDRQPVASTTISAAEVERERVISLKQASEIVPNFYVPDYGSRITSSIYVRGLGARIDQPAVGMNIDNIPVLNKNDYDFDLFNIARIEVLRGPQSVLYGRNTMGGLINIYTLSPLRYQGVRFLAEYGSANSWRTGLGAYWLLKQGLGMSLSVHAAGTDGFYKNEHTGSLADRGTNMSVRWKTAYDSNGGSFKLENTVAAGFNNEGGYPYEWLETNRIAYNDTCFYKRTSLSDGLTMQWRADGFTVSSITGVRYLDDNMTLDQDFTPRSYFTLTQATRELSVTQDLIFRGAKGEYSWMAGAFGFYKHGRMNAPVTFLSDGIQDIIINNALGAMKAALEGKMPQAVIDGIGMEWGADAFELGSRFTIPVGGAAIYHESTWQHGPWKLSGALRLDYEHTALKARNHTSTSCVLTGMGPRPIERVVEIDTISRFSKHFLQLLPKFTASYSLPMKSPSMVYVSVAKGYKSGGYNTQMFSDVLQNRLMAEMQGKKADMDINAVVGYKPEQSWNYEAGAHVECADGRIRTDLAVFYIDCRDQQLTCFPVGEGTGRMMTNAARTRSWGMEANIDARPTDRLTIRATYGFTDARFVRYADKYGDYAGNFIPYSPRHTLFGAVTYRQPIPTSWLHGISLTVDGRGVGPIYWDEENEYRQKLYGLMGVTLGFDHKHYSLDFWGENILNARFSTFYFESINHSFVQRGKPRRMGVTLRVNID